MALSENEEFQWFLLQKVVFLIPICYITLGDFK